MSKIADIFDSIIKKTIVLVVFVMLGLSVLGIVLRWFQLPLNWIEPLVRHLVFLSAFLGATLASASARHISIEILAKYFEAGGNTRVLKNLNKAISVITCLALVFLMQSGFDFFQVEKEYGSDIFFGLHSSTMVFIIPLGFALILVRSFISIFVPVNEEELS